MKRKLKNRILMGITYFAFASLMIAATQLHYHAIAPAAVYLVSSAWIALFMYANQRTEF